MTLAILDQTTDQNHGLTDARIRTDGDSFWWFFVTHGGFPSDWKWLFFVTDKESQLTGSDDFSLLAGDPNWLEVMIFRYWWGIPADLLDVLIRTICWIILCMESIMVAQNGSRLRPAVWLHLDAESLRAVNHMIVVNATGSHKLYIFIVIYIWQCLFSQFQAYLIKHYSTLVKMTFVWSTPHHVQIEIDHNDNLDFTKTMRIVHDDHRKVKYSFRKKNGCKGFSSS